LLLKSLKKTFCTLFCSNVLPLRKQHVHQILMKEQGNEFYHFILLCKENGVLLLTWQHTRKMNKVMAVHSTFSRNWICKTNTQSFEIHTVHNYLILLLYKLKLILDINIRVLSVTRCFTQITRKTIPFFLVLLFLAICCRTVL
jgi:hypothetical protein